MPSDESKGSQLDAIGSLAQRQLDNTPANLRSQTDVAARDPSPARPSLRAVPWQQSCSRSLLPEARESASNLLNLVVVKTGSYG